MFERNLVRDRSRSCSPWPLCLASDGKLALRDPASADRVDVWSPEGKRLVGFLPYGAKVSVNWTGWSRDGSVLLTFGGGKLTGWQVPAAKALFEIDGAYVGLPVHALGAPWLARAPARPASADNPVSGRLTTYLLPDPANPVEAPLTRPNGLEVVFRPGMPVAIEVDFKSAARNEKLAASLKRVLEEFGYPVGGGGWKLQMSAAEFESSDRLMRGPTDREGFTLPGVRVTASFIAPDGTRVFSHRAESRFRHQQSKYFTGKDNLGVASVSHYNFGRREPRAAVADEIWEHIVAQPVRPAPVPHGVARIDGKYTLLPLRVARKTPPGD